MVLLPWFALQYLSKDYLASISSSERQAALWEACARGSLEAVGVLCLAKYVGTWR